MSQKINIFSNKYNLTEDIKKIVINELRKHDFVINEEYDETADFNIVIGGDGTFIKAIHDSNFSKIPFIGINTGHLGFYNDVKHTDVLDAIEKIRNKDFIEIDLRVIDCIVNTDNDKHIFKSINELVLKTKYTEAIHFDLFVDDVLLQKFAGDGIIFSTPSGSTAYNLSAGGAILFQNIDAFQITPLAPIRSTLHRSLDKSLIVPKDTIIKLITSKPEESYFAFGVDGLHKEIEHINNIEIKLSDKKIKKIIFDKNWFWKNITEKFIM